MTYDLEVMDIEVAILGHSLGSTGRSTTLLGRNVLRMCPKTQHDHRSDKGQLVWIMDTCERGSPLSLPTALAGVIDAVPYPIRI